MDWESLGPDGLNTLREVLGYLNFSSGAPDPKFRRNLIELAGRLEARPPACPPWQTMADVAESARAHLAQTHDAFRQSDQAAAVIDLAWRRLPQAYRRHHRDLLGHQSDAALFGPLFLARLAERVLEQGGPWDEADRIVDAALASLNEFVGHRPVAVLESRRHEPDPHERVAPIPLYLRDAGVAPGPYAELVSGALDILRQTDEDLRERASFDPELLDELALDPRAYDFDHPVNKRPNYQFGQWDPHQIDNRGRYRRFVLQEVSLAAIRDRIESTPEHRRDEALIEGATVLAGVILMSACTSGRGPEHHDSTVTLSTLLPQIASLRDDFYQRWLARQGGLHGARLRQEAAALHQPFGGARQHLNQRLARLRASQLQHVHLALLFARLGFLEASRRQAHAVPVPSARMLCEMTGLLHAAERSLDESRPEEAARELASVEDLLKRAIACGALVDPWNILGFQAHFSLFPAVENSVRDHRVDVLIRQVEQLMGGYVRLAGVAAAMGREELLAETERRLVALAAWWDQFATTEVSGIVHVSGQEAIDSAGDVARALGAWHRAGESAGDVAFWRQHVTEFRSPKAFAAVLNTLLGARDFVAAMALLMQWLSQSDDLSLDESELSFFDLAARWLDALHPLPTAPEGGAALPSDRRWALTRKFFDYLEANAEAWWHVPSLDVAEGGRRAAAAPRAEGDEPDDDAGLFHAAYEDVVYRDSTGDGHEGDTLEQGPAPAHEFPLEEEAQRLGGRLSFLSMIARLWRFAAVVAGAEAIPDRDEALAGWVTAASTNRERLLALLDRVQAFPLPPPRGTHESLVEYDRRRQIKESLVGQIVVTTVETSDAVRFLRAASEAPPPDPGLASWEPAAIALLGALLSGRQRELPARFREFRAALAPQPILYVPLSKRGDPREIVAAQAIQHLVRFLLVALPRAGLWTEACDLIVTAQDMERNRPAGEGVVTEFDRLFETGYAALVATLVRAARRRPRELDPETGRGAELIEVVQSVTEALLKRWHMHSRTLRLSALEKVAEEPRWKALLEFIQSYGGELFTPKFFNLGNLRAILHQRVERYLEQLAEADDAEERPRLIEDLDRGVSRADAAEFLTTVIETIIENYGEYKDFNSTTTQSDRGELLFTLLDFLRLKVSYQRFAWNIRPVVIAHDVFVREGATAAAEVWRRAVAERTRDVADWHAARLAALRRQYGMQLPTITDLIQERFVQPLTVDLIRALIRPAVEEYRRRGETTVFTLLEKEVQDFAENPQGAGLDVPPWLVTLEEEASRVLSPLGHADQQVDDLVARLPAPRIRWADVVATLPNWEPTRALPG